MVTVIQALADALCQRDVTVQSVTRMIGGRALERETDRSYQFVPADPRFSHARLDVQEDRSGGEVPLQLELTLKRDAAATLKLSELERVFGKFKRVPPLPGGYKLYRVVFHYSPPNAPFKAPLFATLSDGPENGNALVTEILIQRYERP